MRGNSSVKSVSSVVLYPVGAQTMSPVLTIEQCPPPALGKVIQVIDLLEQLRAAAPTIGTADGLRNVVNLLGQLGQFVGVDSSWTSKLQSILANQQVFGIVLAIVQYVDALLTPAATPQAGAPAVAALTIEAQSFADWLPLVTQIVKLLKSL
jgi:hypothetical protein